MYLAVAATILGQALWLAQPILLLYETGFLVVVAAFVHFYEEPTLRRQFGEQYETYRRAVPAWWPRRDPWVKGAFIGFLPISRGFAKILPVGWRRLTGSRSVRRELRASSGQGAEACFLLQNQLGFTG
jgi:hypothetical protein